ncbi:MAG: hypothetical protein Q7U51_07100 [Methanoregula sp.]|nr:hypothetical protein [Methanoregula sp.]
MAVPETIQPLVDKYTFHRDACNRGLEKYNETQAPTGFHRSVLSCAGGRVVRADGRVDCDCGGE